MKKDNKKKFKLFDLNRDGKGAVEESRKPTLGFFFKLFWRKLPNLLQLNLLMIFQALPILAVVAVYLMGEKSPSATNVLFAPLYGINKISQSPDVLPSLDLSSIQMGFPVFSPPVTYTIIILFVFLIVTWGWQNVGATYILRGLVRGDAVFTFSDFFYAIKKNLKQGFFLGLIDFSIISVLVIDFIYYYTKTGSFGFDFMYFMIFALAIIYFMMRFYLYLLLVTFELKNFKIIKNALIFSVLGIKRNIMALLGIVILVVLHAALTMLLLPVGISLPLILPIVYALAATAFMSAYAAYPVIDKYMIAPYAEENDEEFVYLKENSDDEQESDSTELN